MLDVNEIVAFVEKKYNVQLFDYQKRFLENIVHGRVTAVPRACGTSMLLNGYHAYLSDFYNRRKFEATGYDDAVSGYDVLRHRMLNWEGLKEVASHIDREMFEREFLVKYDDFVSDNKEVEHARKHSS